MNDLGISVTSDLQWNSHISNITEKAEKHLWIVIRTLGFHAPVLAKTRTYMAMVRSIIEYGSSLWNTKSKTNLQKLERIQRKATNFILVNPPYYSPNHINYKNRLTQLKLLPTSYRREILDLVFFLKCLHNKAKFSITQFVNFKDPPRGTITRGASYNTRLFIKRPRYESTSSSYPYRIAKIWNALPQHLQTTLKPLSEPLVIKQFLVPYYREMLTNRFDPDNTCTWITWCSCPRCS